MKSFLATSSLFLGITGLLATAEIGDPATTALGEVKSFSLSDIRGQKHTADEWKGKKAVVLFFLGTECPVSNGYAPEYARLAKQFAERGVLFYGIHPDPEVTAEAAAQHAAEYRLNFAIFLDPTHSVVKPAGIQVVPEAVVLSAQGQILYRGRIDDRYSPEGKRREEPSSRDLENALAAVLEGKPPPVAQTKAFGCPLPSPAK
jgi:peroxiredoxin